MGNNLGLMTRWGIPSVPFGLRYHCTDLHYHIHENHVETYGLYYSIINSVHENTNL